MPDKKAKPLVNKGDGLTDGQAEQLKIVHAMEKEKYGKQHADAVTGEMATRLVLYNEEHGLKR